MNKRPGGCKFLCKVTKMKANHNPMTQNFRLILAVSSYAKLLKWKQITTLNVWYIILVCCKFLCKVTKMKANHNPDRGARGNATAVSSYAKLLKWKQITTRGVVRKVEFSCKFLCKVTKMKANHNRFCFFVVCLLL